mmetsp:Transcript_13037/g.34631  ORF Transcript_13037/g.34631 Transcript_13037/m.34631 type:complete len:244 (-) Transcript_13037:1177-1908(-)
MMRGTPVLPSHFGGAPGGPSVRWALAGGSSGGGGGSVRGAGVTGRRADFKASTRARTSRSKAGASVFSPAASRACRASPRYTNKKRVATASSSGTTQIFEFLVMPGTSATSHNAIILRSGDPKKESLNCGVSGSGACPRCWRRADMAYLIEYDNDVETYTPAPCAAPCSWSFVPDADRRPLRRIQCQFSAGDPCQANLLPCRAFRAANRACRAGGCDSMMNWRQRASGAMRSSNRMFGGKATR